MTFMWAKGVRARVISAIATIATLGLLFLTGCNTAHFSKTVYVHVDPQQKMGRVPNLFLGFSLEWGEAKAMLGVPSTGTNPIFRQLTENLFPYGGGPIVMRIGGDSTDSRELSTSFSKLIPNEISAFSQFYKDDRAQFYLSVELGADDPNLAEKQARFFIKNMPENSLKAIEIGNEPDLYASNGLRPSSYSLDDYFQDFRVWRSQLLPALPPGIGLMGPSWSAAKNLEKLPEFLEQESDGLSIISQHWYAGSACGGKTNPPDYLLKPESSLSGAQAVASSVPLAHAKKLAFRMGEMNSIACSGEAGVSDTFASALWMADSLFELAAAGVDGVNIHMDVDDTYGPFLFNVDTNKIPYIYSVNVIRPEYYGMLLFQQAAPGGSTLIRTDASDGPVKTWATLDERKILRITFINKNKNDAKVSLEVKGYGTGTLTRLLATGFEAKRGITLGGQSFDASQDGRPQGPLKSEIVFSNKGVYEIELPATSAALLTLDPAKSEASDLRITDCNNGGCCACFQQEVPLD
jgi:hypothetical protein